MANPPPPSSEAGGAPLRIVFMGTPALAARILQRLIEAGGAGFAVVGVVTRPDQPRERGLDQAPAEVAVVAAHHQITTLKPSKIRTPEFLAELRAFAADLLVVAAYGRILPDTVLAAPRLGPLNVHASLLPRHRGAAPVEAAILAGDAETGVTIMRITARMDAGPILLQRAVALEAGETQASLKTKLADLGATALLEALRLLRRGELPETPQQEELATYSKPVSKQDAVIDWTGAAAQIERMVRAYDPWPVARTVCGGEDLLIWRAAVAAPPNEPGPAAAPGTLVRLKSAAVVRCGDGFLTLHEVQASGRRRMPAADFFRGRRVASGIRLGT